MAHGCLSVPRAETPQDGPLDCRCAIRRPRIRHDTACNVGFVGRHRQRETSAADVDPLPADAEPEPVTLNVACLGPGGDEAAGLTGGAREAEFPSRPRPGAPIRKSKRESATL